MSSLFSPYTLKDVTLRNRIVASPMCQYQAVEGALNGWHRTHYEALAKGGAGLVVVEATSVNPEGRITPGDAGIWSDDHVTGFAEVALLIKNAGAVPGIQLGHAGRKAGCTPPWVGGHPLEASDPQHWQPVSSSALPYVPDSSYLPDELTVEGIKSIQEDFASAAARAHRAGFEWLELHFAHGFLGQSFLSPKTNVRTDEYGGSLPDRARFLLEIVAAVKQAWPSNLPLTVRFGTVDFGEDLEASMAESIQVLQWLQEGGVDFVDCSLSLAVPGEPVPWGPNFMVPFAERVRAETDLPVGTSWMITDAHEADGFIRSGSLDLVFFARTLLANPHWPFQAARALGIPDPASVLPTPYAYWLQNWG
ncbi:NADH:flavin oxidoreductase/NADH oxidase [Pseudomonas sp. KFB-139]|uniref:NADH:flavin oxidoreductase/NADH oxidase n=1 Tax=Pseudomonas serbiensis TaxID=3064350 RepID=A0ABT9CLD0_9PSED|nr:NADH:flavin oxidoreductase/NADH oxidase [Pseudomonas sp. KFB-138]MDO7926273.1 NADH:flavin oxidoreductase/NADH oxidase [Pseudomonas sp. KFB-138]